MLNTRQFYDDLSSYYHLIFEDWDASMARQTQVRPAIPPRCKRRSPWPPQQTLRRTRPPLILRSIRILSMGRPPSSACWAVVLRNVSHLRVLQPGRFHRSRNAAHSPHPWQRRRNCSRLASGVSLSNPGEPEREVTFIRVEGGQPRLLASPRALQVQTANGMISRERPELRGTRLTTDFVAVSKRVDSHWQPGLPDPASCPR
jgi:hypothetical protein